MTASVRVELQRASEVASLPEPSEIRRWIEAAVEASGDGGSRPCDIVVRVVDEQESRDLNYRYRGKDRPTNVLAFPADRGVIPGLRASRRRTLGDLAICGPVVEREAAEQGKAAAAHWGHLLVHGTLHLLGYDHRTQVEARAMERLEAGILAGCGIGDPYV